MIVELGVIGVFIVILLLIFAFSLFMWGLHYAIAYAINALIGFFALYFIKAFGIFPDIAINFWSVAIVAVGGIIGFGIVLFLHGLNVWF